MVLTRVLVLGKKDNNRAYLFSSYAILNRSRPTNFWTTPSKGDNWKLIEQQKKKNNIIIRTVAEAVDLLDRLSNR